MAFACDRQKELMNAEYRRLHYSQLRAKLKYFACLANNSKFPAYEKRLFSRVKSSTNGKWPTSKQNEFAWSDVLDF